MDIREGVMLSAYATLKVGGPADFFVEVSNIAELKEAVRFAQERSLPLRVIGGGSNILVDDSGVRGLVIKNNIGGVTYTEAVEAVTVTAGAGVVFDELVLDTVSRGLWGLENLSAIPGYVGATPVQNVGAYGVEVADLIISVEVFDTVTLREIQLTPVQCDFTYRDSLFKKPEGRRYIVTAVAYTLSTVPRPQLSYRDLSERFSGTTTPTLTEVRDAVMSIRSAKFPDWHVVGTAGSYFKNPIIPRVEYEKLLTTYPLLPSYEMSPDLVKIPLGFVLDKVCGLRGYRDGEVGTYEGQALVIVNYGATSSADIENFARMIEQKVFEKINVRIEREVIRVS